MPNDCWCSLQIGAPSNLISEWSAVDFLFSRLRKAPENGNSTDWCYENWGTKWDRYEYECIQKGPEGIQIKFTTAWCPPLRLLEYLLESNKNIWIKCEWLEEGGMAGTWIGRSGKELGDINIQKMEWEDWCVEEWCHRMGESKEH